MTEILHLELDHEPFSAFGSWMAFSRLAGRRAPSATGDGLYLRTIHRSRDGFPLLLLEPIASGQPCPYQIACDGLRLILRCDGVGEIEIGFDGPDTIRLRGRGVGLRLRKASWSVAYSTGENLVTCNMAMSHHRHQIERMQGRLVCDGLWRADRDEPFRVELLPGDDGAWEAALDEFVSSWNPRARLRFDDALSRTRQAMDAFAQGVYRNPHEHALVARHAAYTDWAAVVKPCKFLRRPTMLMSKNWMCSVWSWDHCFNAMAVAPAFPELALDQFLVMADHQDEDGAYPDATTDEHLERNFVKPPIHGWAFMKTLELLPGPPSAAMLGTIYDSFAALARFWTDHQTLLGQTLPHYLHGNDSGWDNGTMFDAGVPLVAPDLAAFLVAHMDALAEMAGRHLDKPDEAAIWRTRANRMFEELMSQLWNGEMFIARLGLTGEPVESDCLLHHMPILLGDRLPEDVRRKLVARIERHLTEWGLATEPPDSPKYQADGYWRGPIWAPSSMLIIDGLKRAGRADLAATIAERFLKLCAKSGFAENFDAQTGAGLRDRAYSWTASVFLCLAREAQKGVNP